MLIGDMTSMLESDDVIRPSDDVEPSANSGRFSEQQLPVFVDDAGDEWFLVRVLDPTGPAFPAEAAVDVMFRSIGTTIT